MTVIDTPDVGLHVACLGIHAHEAGAQERLVVADAVERRHHRVLVAFQGIDRHLDRLVECCFNLGIRVPGLLHL